MKATSMKGNVEYDEMDAPRMSEVDEQWDYYQPPTSLEEDSKYDLGGLENEDGDIDQSIDAGLPNSTDLTNSTSSETSSSSTEQFHSTSLLWSNVTARRVLQGTCGWTDPTLLRCGKFYPRHAKSGTERLRHYSSFFPCVEVDSSNYAIPTISRINSWLQVTPPDFLFHFKVFGIFASTNARVDAIPHSCRHLLPSTVDSKGTITLGQCSPELVQALWAVQNASLLPVYEANKLGLVVFQYHLFMAPSKATIAHVRACRAALDKRFRMAVEFRNRKWSAPEKIEESLKLLRELDIVWVAEDDLEHETYSPNAPPPPIRIHLPILFRIASPIAMYVRLHRRIGNARVLEPWEYEQWAMRFADAAERKSADNPYEYELQGPIFFMIGTDWEDQPIINAKNMEKAVKRYTETRGQGDSAMDEHVKQESLPSSDLIYPWREIAKKTLLSDNMPSLFSMFAHPPTVHNAPAIKLKQEVPTDLKTIESIGESLHNSRKTEQRNDYPLGSTNVDCRDNSEVGDQEPPRSTLQDSSKMKPSSSFASSPSPNKKRRKGRTAAALEPAAKRITSFFQSQSSNGT